MMSLCYEETVQENVPAVPYIITTRSSFPVAENNVVVRARRRCAMFIVKALI